MSSDDTSPSNRPVPILPALIFQTARELRTVLDQRMAPHRLTLQQASLLIRCVRHKGANPHELRSHLGTDKAGVSRLIDRLESANLVIRRAGADRRANALEATKAGKDLTPELEKILAAARRQILANLSAEETAQLERLLGRILASAKGQKVP